MFPYYMANQAGGGLVKDQVERRQYYEEGEHEQGEEQKDEEHGKMIKRFPKSWKIIKTRM